MHIRRKHYKSKIALFLLVFSFILHLQLPIYAEPASMELSCEGAILMEASTGTILFEQNADALLRPASVTKIMTMLLIFEALEKGQIALDDVVFVSAHAASMGGSQVFLEENEPQTVETLLKCISIASANDASVAMAEFIAGSEEEFVNRMNQKAVSLGMKNTNFVNCCGLDADGHLTSARDVAIMSRELITKYPQIHNYSTVWMDEFEHVTKKGTSKFGLTNTNKLISTYPYATGLKTGSTSLAKYSVSATATKDDVTLIAVVMADVDYKVRFTNAQKLLDYGFANCKIYKDENPPKLAAVKVKNGTQSNVNLCYHDYFTYIDTTGSNLSSIKTVLNLPDEIRAPIRSDQIIGTIDYYLNEKKIGSLNIYPTARIDKITFKYCLIQMLYSLLP